MDSKFSRPSHPPRVVVGMTGSSGVIYGVRLLEVLQEIHEVETHLILSKGAEVNLRIETAHTAESVKALADIVHDVDDLAAPVSSGSYPVKAMIVMPCSMKSLAQIALSLNDNLLTRAADVTLKERRRLIVVPRETPLHLGHLKHMVSITEMGGTILPPSPSFYHSPKNIQDIIDQTVGKVLDQLDLPHHLFKRWGTDE